MVQVPQARPRRVDLVFARPRPADTIAIAVSESTGTVRIFQDGTVVLRIEPMDQAMKWNEVANDSPLD